MRVCAKCRKNEALNERGPARCGDCRVLDPDNVGEYMRARWKARQAMIDAYKLEQGCADCGYAEHAVALDFDHIDPSEKDFNVSQGLTKSIESLMAEVEKCEVVCANCHRIRTHLTI